MILALGSSCKTRPISFMGQCRSEMIVDNKRYRALMSLTQGDIGFACETHDLRIASHLDANHCSHQAYLSQENVRCSKSNAIFRN
jgi:hypothetical protein